MLNASKKITVEKPTELGIADLAIFAAELLHEAVEAGEVQVNVETTLKSTGKTYKTTIIVNEI